MKRGIILVWITMWSRRRTSWEPHRLRPIGDLRVGKLIVLIPDPSRSSLRVEYQHEVLRRGKPQLGERHLWGRSCWARCCGRPAQKGSCSVCIGLGAKGHGWPVVTPAAMSAPLCRAILPTIRWRVMRTFTPMLQAPVGRSFCSIRTRTARMCAIPVLLFCRAVGYHVDDAGNIIPFRVKHTPKNRQTSAF